MSTETKDELDIKVSEAVDGSAVVDLPDSLAQHGDEDDDDSSDDQKLASGGDAGGDDDADHPDDTDAIRAARRNRRRAKKEYIKRTNEEKDQRLQLLSRQNQELQERLSVVERRTHSTELARMDKAIEDAELKMQYARMKMAEATSAGDGEAMAKAQDMWYETRRQVEAMRNTKERAAQAPQAQPTDQRSQRELQRHASNWMERNSWYDPESTDEDVEIAKIVDQKLVKEGWNPAQQEYWDELDKRLQKRLPHRYNDEQDERVSRSRPRSVVTSSGRENSASSGGSRNTFVLSPEQVRAMKDAGFWDNPTQRAKMIKRYAIENRNNSRN
jgi:hypothetical protein